MANAEHIRILKKQGVNTWNAWRRRMTNVRSNLSGGNLRFANLRNADFSRADLSSANLGGANLSKANLVRANLIAANLGRTDLSGADLSGANLAGAFLGNDINLIGADLSGARLSGTIFSDVDLSGCKNLESIHHMGPSTIDIRTLQRSGPLPLSFLRGVGLPEKLIDYLPSLLGEATYYSCFISYSTKDDDFVHRLYADLQDKGVRCWFAPHDLPIGAKTLDTIDEAIRLRDKVLLVLSEASIASDWVEDEVTKAFEEERQRDGVVVFPVRVDDAVFSTKEAWALKLRANRNIGDFRAWKDHDAYQRTLERLLRDLLVEKGPS
jgi:TIR domain/Pentapeptide repeats (8 copies)/Pentapeptide repeats (9 copies)